MKYILIIFFSPAKNIPWQRTGIYTLLLSAPKTCRHFATVFYEFQSNRVNIILFNMHSMIGAVCLQKIRMRLVGYWCNMKPWFVLTPKSNLAHKLWFAWNLPCPPKSQPLQSLFEAVSQTTISTVVYCNIWINRPSHHWLVMVDKH